MIVSSKICCYCGVNEATTKDHIPPKAIFNRPRPSDLITVPSCFKCNNEASKFDEKFKVYLGMHVARQRNEGEGLFKNGVLPSIRHNNLLRGKILSSMKPVNIVSKSAQIIDKAASVLWDSEVHDVVIERMVRGLFYHHFKKILADKSDISIYYFDTLPEDLSKDLIVRSIGNGAFVYAYGDIEDGYSSIWLFQFYQGHWAGGITLEK